MIPVAAKGAAAGSRKNKARAAVARRQAGRNKSVYKIPTVWLSVKDAAEQLGISQTTLRSRIRDGYFRTTPAARGKATLVEIPAS